MFGGTCRRRLRARFFLIALEKEPGSFQIEQVAVHEHLVVAGILSDGDDVLYAVALFTEGVHEKFDIYHGMKRRWVPGVRLCGSA